MADAPPPPAEAMPEKGLLARLMLPLILVLAGAAAGAAGAVFMPSLIPLGGPSGAMSKEKPPEPVVAPLQYVEIDNSFTANLKDTGRFIQVRIAISTQGGPPVAEAVERHRVAVIAAVLGVLAETAESDITVAGGREALTRKMRIAINDVLQRKSGIAGIDDVFITSFVLQ